jgi:phosphopentomutase
VTFFLFSFFLYHLPFNINLKMENVSLSAAFTRVTLIVLDGVGVGEMPDAAEWGDAGSDTIGHVCATRKLEIPHLVALGLSAVRSLPGFPESTTGSGAYGKCALRSNGKDTTTGHWEMAGIVLEKGFRTYPDGFPQSLLDEFIAEAKLPGILGNYPASGTEIIKELGEEHVQTGKPIIYTSGDSVFQVAAHEEIIPLERLYEICETARGILRGEHQVGRVIARPFLGKPGSFYRTENRHDYAVTPPHDNLLTKMSDSSLQVTAIGKIASIFNSLGVTRDLTAKNNQQSIDQTCRALSEFREPGLIFSNLVDFDMLYGHRRDIAGFAKALEHFDAELDRIRANMDTRDLLIITADHGNDPTFRGTDHTREYVPLLMWGSSSSAADMNNESYPFKANRNVGTRGSLADIGQTIAENFGLRLEAGTSFLNQIS